MNLLQDHYHWVPCKARTSEECCPTLQGMGTPDGMAMAMMRRELGELWLGSVGLECAQRCCCCQARVVLGPWAMSPRGNGQRVNSHEASSHRLQRGLEEKKPDLSECCEVGYQ